METFHAGHVQDKKRFSFLAAEQWTDVFLVSVNPVHARHFRELCVHCKCSGDMLLMHSKT